MVLLAITANVTTSAKTITCPTKGGAQYTKLNIHNRFSPDPSSFTQRTADVWIRTDGTAAVVAADENVQCPPDVSVEIPWAATISVICERGSTRVNVVGVI